MPGGGHPARHVTTRGQPRRRAVGTARRCGPLARIHRRLHRLPGRPGRGVRDRLRPGRGGAGGADQRSCAAPAGRPAGAGTRGVRTGLRPGRARGAHPAAAAAYRRRGPAGPTGGRDAPGRPPGGDRGPRQDPARPVARRQRPAQLTLQDLDGALLAGGAEGPSSRPSSSRTARGVSGTRRTRNASVSATTCRSAAWKRSGSIGPWISRYSPRRKAGRRSGECCSASPHGPRAAPRSPEGSRPACRVPGPGSAPGHRHAVREAREADDGTTRNLLWCRRPLITTGLRQITPRDSYQGILRVQSKTATRRNGVGITCRHQLRSARRQVPPGSRRQESRT